MDDENERKGLKGKISVEERKDYHLNRIHLSGSTRRRVIFSGRHLAKITRLGHLPIKVRVSKGILRDFQDPSLQSDFATRHMQCALKITGEKILGSIRYPPKKKSKRHVILFEN